jgi:hypothetical protein
MPSIPFSLPAVIRSLKPVSEPTHPLALDFGEPIKISRRYKRRVPSTTRPLFGRVEVEQRSGSYRNPTQRRSRTITHDHFAAAHLRNASNTGHSD